MPRSMVDDWVKRKNAMVAPNAAPFYGIRSGIKGGRPGYRITPEDAKRTA